MRHISTASLTKGQREIRTNNRSNVLILQLSTLEWWTGGFWMSIESRCSDRLGGVDSDQILEKCKMMRLIPFQDVIYC